MSIEDERSMRERDPHRRGRNPRISDETDEDSEMIAPPAKLLALFVIPLILLMVWAFAQS